MPIQIDLNGRQDLVARDLLKICPDPNLSIHIASQVLMFGDAGVTASGPGTVAFRTRPNVSSPGVATGTQLLAHLTDPFNPSTVIIRGLGSNDNAFNGQPIRNAGGKTSPVTSRDGVNFIVIEYDTDGCARGAGFKNGYIVIGQSKQAIDMPPDVILFHELVHAFHRFNGLAGATADAEELQTAVHENLYRAQRMLPLRSTDTAELMGMKLFHAGHPQCEEAVQAPVVDKTMGSATSSSWCPFVVAMTMVPLLGPDLQPLREFRNDVLLNTKSGQEFFAIFNKYYYQYGAGIADAMRADPAMGAIARVGHVEPTINFFRLFMEFPQGDPSAVPQPWRNFLEEASFAFSNWASQFPLPVSYRDQPVSMAVRELALFVRYRLRTEDAVTAYLAELEEAGELPLAVKSADERLKAAEVLGTFGFKSPVIDRILGGSANKITASGVLAAFGPDEMPPNIPPEKFAYTVTIRNRTDTTTPATLEEVVLTFQRVGADGIEFRFADNLQPGKGVVFALCPCEELVAYAWGFRVQVFDEGKGEIVDLWFFGPDGKDFVTRITPASRNMDEIATFGAPVACADSYQITG